ncbi:MAG: hypothetical protein E6K80_10105 [Candidatus Eisenbacteria bacterium]|uniref:PilZ domain-containing protein n=1 Tax=Eiseniibacteriota bacterium TaxID=2212470 RepID=A0A538U233_UNCEI|nr:MAG: hypothetical protein E6K80_10105 [Candidatus Eisenbacteria bacterium]
MPRKKGIPKIERRTSTRADASLSMRVEGEPQNGTLTHIVTESENISASGVYCSSPHYLAPLSKVALTIVLPNQKATQRSRRLLKCDGVVVRCEPTRVGARPSVYELACSFIGLDPRHRLLLDDFVTWRNLQTMRSTPAKKRTPTTKRPRRATERSGARATKARPAGARRATSR